MVSAVIWVLAVACFRYETRMRPMRSDECPPEPPLRTFSHIVADRAARGALRGRVRVAMSRAPTWSAASDSALPPLSAARVIVDSIRRGASSDAAGRYAIDSLAPGRYVVRVLRVGYRPLRDTVVVTESAGVVWDMTLESDIMDRCPGFASVAERKRVWHWPWQ